VTFTLLERPPKPPAKPPSLSLNADEEEDEEDEACALAADSSKELLLAEMDEPNFDTGLEAVLSLRLATAGLLGGLKGFFCLAGD